MTTTTSHQSTPIKAFLTPEDCANQIQQWGKIRTMTKEEASANLEGEELKACNRYYTEVHNGV